MVRALESIGFDSLSDWKSFADWVVVVRVTSEERRPDPAAATSGDSTPSRYVHVTVERILWARDRRPAGSLTFLTYGWIEASGQEVPVRAAGGPRLEVDGRYLMGMIAEPRVGALSASSVLPVAGGRVQVDGATIGFARSLDGLTVDEVATRLEAARPDPLAAEHPELPPAARASLVRASREAGP